MSARAQPPIKSSRDSGRPRVLVLLAWYATEVFRGIARGAQSAHWIMDSSYERNGKIPLHWQGDGIIAVLGVDPEVDAFVKRSRVPIVNIGYSFPEAAPRVMADQEAITRLAVDHFFVRGFRHFAYYQRSGNPGDCGRGQAFRAALAARGITPELIDHTTRAPSDRQATTLWLQRQIMRLPKPLAVFSEFDDYAIEVLEAAAAAGINVPGEVAVLGVGNDELRCPFAPIPLSSVNDNPAGIGEAAATLLGKLMQGEAAPDEPLVVPPLGVVTRRSTDILAVEHPLVALALQEIRKHFREPITAEGMVASIPMSRRRLHDAFLRFIGRSVADEVTRLRLNHAKRMLTETDAKHHQIASECGFSSESRLAVVFRREIGLTPGEYRSRFNPLFSHGRKKIGRPSRS